MGTEMNERSKEAARAETLYGPGRKVPTEVEEAVDGLRKKYLKPGNDGEQEPAAEEEGERPVPLRGLQQDEAMAKVLWTDKDPRELAEGDLQDTAGDLLHRASSSGGTRENTAINNSSDLREANLEGLDFTGPGMSLDGADLRRANCRGMKFPQTARGAKLDDIEVDAATDLSGCDFTGSVMSRETYSRLRNCQGIAKTRGLVKPRPSD